MEYCFCFANKFVAENAQVERKKIDRGISITAKWDNPDAPTITYDARIAWDGTVNYRVKFNATVITDFDGEETELVWEFRQALHELADAGMKRDATNAAKAEDVNTEGAMGFFRGDLGNVMGSLSAAVKSGDRAAQQRAARISTEGVTQRR